MAEFQQIRDDLRQSRTAADQARLDLFKSGQQVKMIQKRLDALQRQKGDNNASYIREVEGLNRQLAAEKANHEKNKNAYERASEIAGGLEKNFTVFTDPRVQLENHFPADTPFLLFPLRMETRFKTINNQPQLWVRVYPDECLVDSFDPLLSQKEVNNAARFWAEYYSAGTPADPAHPDAATIDLQKAAWALLVNAAGEGRAAWIARQLIPDPATSIFPVRGAKTVIISIVSGNWNAADQAAITGLFKQLWFADGNDMALQKIKTDFNAANPLLNADDLIENYKPVNFNDSLPLGLKRADADLQVAIVSFPDLDKKAEKEKSWSQPSRVNLLPERLALIRYKGNVAMEPIFGSNIPFPLPTSPDPSPDAGKQFEQTAGGDLEFADAIKWVADFDRAVAIGMGFKINLAQDELNGFTRLMVLGIKLGADATTGKKELETLIDHHYFSKKGFSMLPQGIPTNNTGSSDSRYSSADDADVSFDRYFKQVPAFEETDDQTKRNDGQWLAEWLGLDYSFTKKLLHADGLDQADARNMNTALWPATLGYIMESMMQGGFSDETIAATRDFFNSFVSGRGPVPAIRIGNQPYGILPTSAFRRQNWMNADNRVLLAAGGNQLTFLRGLYQLLLRIDNNWNATLANAVAHVAIESNQPYQTLLDVIGLHPNSAEYHRRYLESLIEMSNAMSLIKAGFREHSDIVNNNMSFLKSTLGYPTDILPQIAALLGLPWQDTVQFLIDDQPLSELKPVRDYTADKKNYITALLEQAKKSLDAIRTGAGLSERPDAELYRLMKYALETGYHSSGLGAAAATAALPAEKISLLKTEQPFVQQQFKGAVTESRYALLYNTVPAISPVKTVSEFITDSLSSINIPVFSKYLGRQLDALNALQGASTARLERAFVEHLDCCSYRLDAWKTGLLTNGLAHLRNNGGGIHDQQRKAGMYIGAFGWLENVQPAKNKTVSNITLPQELIPDFNADGSKTFLQDAANEGYIHAPSLNQGVTAAVLRNGYISHGKPDANNVLAVNLSSERIRLALSVIEGIQGGQSLAALLGYHFERELHDRSDLTAKGIDVYIYALRKLFPLNADQIKETRVANTTDPSVDPNTVPITAIEARNVVHGVNLSNHVKSQTIPANKNFPFGLSLANPDPAVGTAITDAVNHIIDIADAVADLGMAESVHHIVMGNYDRAAGVLESFSKGNYPQEPDVTRTPRSGATLTHRVGIPFEYIALAAGESPRVQTEPSMNQWLSAMLPAMDKITCEISYIRRSDESEQKAIFSMQELGLAAIDLIYLLNTQQSQSMGEIEDRLMDKLFAAADPKMDGLISFNYTAANNTAGNFSLFEVIPLIKSLRSLVLESALLTPGDIALPNEASKKDAAAPEIPSQRVADLIITLKAVLAAASTAAGIIGYLRSLPAPATATSIDLDNIRNKADDSITRFSRLLLELAAYGIPQTSTAAVYTQRQQWFVSLKSKLQVVKDRWQKNKNDYLLLAADPTPGVEKLQAMERLVSSVPTAADTITQSMVDNKFTAFSNALTTLSGIQQVNQPGIALLLQAIQAFDTTPFDVVALDISTEIRQVPQFIYDLQARAAVLIDDIEKKRLPDTESIIAALPALSITDQARQIEAAAKIILGDAFKMIPKYTIPAAQAAEISNSWNARNDLLDYSVTVGKRANPTEDWLHGIARVHDKMKQLEQCLLLREAFGLDENDLLIHPTQFPFESVNYHWMALPFPTDEIDLEKTNTLLYTAFVKGGSPSPLEICGVLADEWTELIPATEETTGITFHYDRPNAEAPQTLLLVTPPSFTGNWQWNDLADALSYTLDAARSRGIEPDNLDKTAYAPFLPAVYGAESLYPYHIVLDHKAHYMEAAVIKNMGTTLNQ